MPKIKTPSRTPIALRAIYDAAVLGIRTRIQSLCLRLEAASYDPADLEQTHCDLVDILRSVREYRVEAPDPAVVASTVTAQALLAAANVSAAWLPTPEASLGAWSLDFISHAAWELGADTADL